MRTALLLFGVLLTGALSGTAQAQPLAPECYAPDRGGSLGPLTEVGCYFCCGCRGPGLTMEWQVRVEADSWATLVSSQAVPGRYANRSYQALTHGARYCTRVRFVDDAGPGDWGPAASSCGVSPSDVCFTYDDAPPAPPVVLDAGVTPGTSQLVVQVAPTSDDGGGVLWYALRHEPVGAAGVYPQGYSTTTDVDDLFGPGTWSARVVAYDHAGNVSAPSGFVQFTVGFDASIPVPPAPAWPVAYTKDPYVTLGWVRDGGESWAVTQEGLDGGWRVAIRPRVRSNQALLSVPGPCRVHRARIAATQGLWASDWSAPSAGLLSDTIAPSAPVPFAVEVSGAAAVGWSAATDGCPSGLTYRLERRVNGGPFVTRGTTGTLGLLDPLDVEGLLEWRLVVTDGAGNATTSGPSAALTWSFDAGVADAGAPDAGAPDAGEALDGGAEADAGAPSDGGAADGGSPEGGVDPGDERHLLVGCGCDSTTAAAIAWAGLTALLRRRRRFAALEPRLRLEEG